MSAVRRTIIGLVLAAASVIAAPAFAATGVVPNPSPASLNAGHCIATKSNEPSVDLESHSTRFRVYLYNSGQLEIDNDVEIGGSGDGYTTRMVYLPRHEGRRASLCMTTSGDLVLRKNGHIEWHTKTAGKARGGHVSITNAGRLLVANASGRVVWSSHTTTVLLTRGYRLPSGATLVNRTYPGSTTRLEMARDGNLILTRNHETLWQTSTHVAGSVMVITDDGRVAVRSPQHKTLWRSPADGRNAILRVAQAGRLVLSRSAQVRGCWVRPSWSDQDCGTG